MKRYLKIIVFILLFSLIIGVAYADAGGNLTIDASGGYLTIDASGGYLTIDATRGNDAVMLSGFIAIIIFSLLLLTAVILLPWYLNIYHGYKIRNRILDNIENNHTFFADCIKEDREKIITQLLAPPEKKGTTRFTMMAGVTFIIATVILYILIAHGPENSTILQSALGVLTGAFAAIIGFYFGGRVYPPEELTKEKLKELAQEMREDGKKLSQPETIKNSESENTEKQQSNNEKID